MIVQQPWESRGVSRGDVTATGGDVTVEVEDAVRLEGVDVSSTTWCCCVAVISVRCSDSSEVGWSRHMIIPRHSNASVLAYFCTGEEQASTMMSYTLLTI